MAFLANTDRERRIMKLWAGGGIATITLGLFALNTTGAYNASGGNWFYTISVGGAEIVVAVAFGFTVLAQTWLRRIVCGLIFLFLLVACIENGKLAIQQSFSSVFVDTAEALREKALVAEAQAREIDAQKADVRANAGEDLSRVRNEIAELKLELELMSSATRIREAQIRLKALGEYTGPIDGIRAELTEQAMLQRGETIRKRLAVLEEREATGGILTGVSAGADPAAEKRIEAIRLRTQAEEVVYRTYWMHLILIALEGARSFGVWAFLMVSTVRRKDQIEETVSEDVPAGKVRVEMTDEEWAEYQRAKEVHDNIKGGAKKGATTRRRGNKIEATREYMEERVSEFMTDLAKGMSPAQVAAAHGLTLASLEASYGRYFTAEEYDAFFAPRPPPEPEIADKEAAIADPVPELADEEEPEPPVAMADSPQDEEELTIPPEPKEWGITPYEPPANEDEDEEDPQDEPKEAAGV